jgi:class 3 adenylate cyclase/predicted ATPase
VALAEPAVEPRRRQDGPEGEGERRHLTIAFCDLVDSTALAERLDPEDWRDAVMAYHDAAAAIVSRYDSHVARLLGDGLLIYFGYPRAHEDDPARALRASLELIEAMGPVNQELMRRHGVTLHLRIGVHTGPVIVGVRDSGHGREAVAVGDTMNLAARLQTIAEPDTVVTSEATRRLVVGQFVTQDRGAYALKGIAEPVRVHAVLQPSGVRSRLDAAERLTPFVGREQELGLLLDRWEHVCDGRGQVSIVIGEAGVGKSRLVLRLRERLVTEPHTWLECRGTPYTTNSPFASIIELVEQNLALEAGDSPAEKLAKIRHRAALIGFSADDTVAVLGRFLGLPMPDGERAADPSAESIRNRAIDLLVAWTLAMSAQQPVLLLVEDLHWCDPSSLELLGRLVAQLPTARIMVVMTTRPELEIPWRKRSHVAPITLGRLSTRQVHDMLREISPELGRRQGAIDRIASRADGIPLFVEELAKAVLASEETANSSIPETLQDSLMARLDRLIGAKETAQLAAVLGREFSHTLLARVARAEPTALEAALTELVAAGIVFVRGVAPDAHYSFKHALIQDAAYASLLKSRRREHHRRVAEVLEAEFADVVAEQPEIVAQHYANGAVPERAAQLWLDAGRLSLRRNAHLEAAVHLRSALGALTALPDTPERALAELDVQITLGTALVAAKGYASADVEVAWRRAQQLLKTVGDVAQQFPALFGLWMFECVRANHRAARELSAEILRRAEAVRSDDLLIEARLAMGISNFFLGELSEARSHFEYVDAIYDAEQHGAHRFQFGQDPAAIALSYLSLVYWLLGAPSRARDASSRALTFARSLAHPFTLSFVLAFAGWHRLFCGLLDGADAAIAELIPLCTTENIPVFLAHGCVLAAWSRCERGDAEGPAAMQAALRDFRATGSRCFLPHWEAFHAEALSAAGAHAEAAERLESAFIAMENTDEGYAESELHRLQGIMLERSGADRAAVEVCHRRALEIARKLGAKAWELRAATNLAGCLGAQGRTPDARAELENVLSRLAELSEERDFAAAVRQLQSLPV